MLKVVCAELERALFMLPKSEILFIGVIFLLSILFGFLVGYTGGIGFMLYESFAGPDDYAVYYAMKAGTAIAVIDYNSKGKRVLRINENMQEEINTGEFEDKFPIWSYPVSEPTYTEEIFVDAYNGKMRRLQKMAEEHNIDVGEYKPESEETDQNPDQQ